MKLSLLLRKYLGLGLGPVLFFILLFGKPFSELGPEANATLAVTVWVSIWWIVEIVPIPVTSLLPIVLLPLANAASIDQTTAAYGDKMLFLFVGGFIIALAMEKSNLHRRIALNIINFVGTSPAKILLGFMVATGLLSMWISNTATTLMMLTIVTAIIHQLSTKNTNDLQLNGFFKSLLLGIAYAASIGGIATLVGTPTNPIFVAIANDLYHDEVSFYKWMLIGIPFSTLLILIAWRILLFQYKIRRINLAMDNQVIKNEIIQLGKISYEEKAVAIVFGFTAFAWIFRSLLIEPFLPMVNDTSIAIFSAVVLFLIPAKGSNNLGILTWAEAVKIPWGVILLFGGGLSLAAAFKSSGLAFWLGQQLSGLDALPIFLLILFVTIFVNFMTEITSNVATASIILPVLAALSDAIGIHPYLLMIPATMAASCAFMLPVATAPNAIVFGSGIIKVRDMAASGFALNLTSSVIISLITYFLVSIIFGL